MGKKISEAKNGGWKRWDGSELRVGGKCLVQVDYKDKELDNTPHNNNNLSRSSNDKDNNGNGSKELTKNCQHKREPAFLYGHIQEMSKDEGPVVVFIEEVGEKRTFPFAALKPIGPRRNKQINWSSNNCRRNSTFDTSTSQKYLISIKKIHFIKKKKILFYFLLISLNFCLDKFLKSSFQFLHFILLP